MLGALLAIAAAPAIIAILGFLLVAAVVGIIVACAYGLVWAWRNC